MTQHGRTVTSTAGWEEQMTKQQIEPRSTRDSHHHGLPVVFTAACGGGGTGKPCHLLHPWVLGFLRNVSVPDGFV